MVNYSPETVEATIVNWCQRQKVPRGLQQAGEPCKGAREQGSNFAGDQSKMDCTWIDER